MNPQADKIYEILKDGNWHCPIDWAWTDGHGKRLTDINRYLQTKNQTLKWDWCDCGRHTTKIKKRKIVDLKPKFDVEKWNSQFYPKTKQPLKTLF